MLIAELDVASIIVKLDIDVVYCGFYRSVMLEKKWTNDFGYVLLETAGDVFVGDVCVNMRMCLCECDGVSVNMVCVCEMSRDMALYKPLCSRWSVQRVQLKAKMSFYVFQTLLGAIRAFCLLYMSDSHFQMKSVTEGPNGLILKLRGSNWTIS